MNQWATQSSNRGYTSRFRLSSGSTHSRSGSLSGTGIRTRYQRETGDSFGWTLTLGGRIVDPLLFFQRLRDERGAQSRLDDILDGETRNAVARHNLIELVRSSNRATDEVQIESKEEAVILETIDQGRQQITLEILARAAERTADLGIELLDLRLKRINYVEEVQQDVFARMIAERQRIAEEFRSEGQGEAARIDGERERELSQITSVAYREAEELRGAADAEATGIYANAYNRDPDFYAFTKSLETYEETMDPSTLFILGTDNELLKFLEQSR